MMKNRKTSKLPQEGVICTMSLALQGSILGDWIAAMFCPSCSLCQLKRDINRRREMGIFW